MIRETEEEGGTRKKKRRLTRKCRRSGSNTYGTRVFEDVGGCGAH